MIDRNSNVVHLCRDEERFLTFIRSSSDENRKGRSWEEEEHEEEEEEEEKKEEEKEEGEEEEAILWTREMEYVGTEIKLG